MHTQEAVRHCRKHGTFWCCAQNQQQTNGGNKPVFPQHTLTHTLLTLSNKGPEFTWFSHIFWHPLKMTHSWGIVFFSSHFKRLRTKYFQLKLDLYCCITPGWFHLFFYVKRFITGDPAGVAYVLVRQFCLNLIHFKGKDATIVTISPWCCVI